MKGLASPVTYLDECLCLHDCCFIMIFIAFIDFYSLQIRDASSDPRKRWSVIRDALHQAERQDTNSIVNSRIRCKSFADHFTSKIENIKSVILQQSNGRASEATVSDGVFTCEQFTTLTPPSIDEVAKLISSMPVKSSPMDAFLTSIMK